MKLPSSASGTTNKKIRQSQMRKMDFHESIPQSWRGMRATTPSPPGGSQHTANLNEEPTAVCTRRIRGGRDSPPDRARCEAAPACGGKSTISEYNMRNPSRGRAERRRLPATSLPHLPTINTWNQFRIRNARPLRRVDGSKSHSKMALTRPTLFATDAYLAYISRQPARNDIVIYCTMMSTVALQCHA